MAVSKVDGQFIAEAIKYIDENGVPWHNMSTKYELVWENGNTYPPKYVIAVANHLQNGAEIDVSGYNAVEAKNYLTAKGYEIQIKQTKYEITITSESVTSTDDSFTMDNISAEMCSSRWMHHLFLPMELLSKENMGKVRDGIQTKLYHVLRFKFMKNRLQPCQ